ncbi:MAG: right-handed parallel beta-helix repeat-containing protein [Planctomycetes bacterium]|nr:right-handed parallel beta-helix repeat-containing protein [Planctomycetota bacterium]
MNTQSKRLKLFLAIALCATSFIAFADCATAEDGGAAAKHDLYITPDGAGAKDGSNWDNAIAYNAEEKGFQRAWDMLTPGSTLYVGAGDYAAKPLKLDNKGTSKDEIKAIKGVAKDGKLPVLTGTWQKNDKEKGFTLFEIACGASWWAIDNFKIKNCRNVVDCASPGQVSFGTVSNLDIEETRDGIAFKGGAWASKPEIGSHDITISNCKVVHYTKRGFRFRDGCYNIKVENCLADAGGKEWAVEAFHMGFNTMGGENGVYDHDITYINCVTRNNYWDAGEDHYWNADGFCAEGNSYNLTYIGCESYDNTDGGWDDKSRNPLLIGCFASRNQRNIRMWAGDKPAVLVNCVISKAYKRGGNSSIDGIWTKGTVILHNSSVVGNKNPLQVNTWHETAESIKKKRIITKDCIVTMSDEFKANMQGDVQLSESVVLPETPQEGEALAYAKPDKLMKLTTPGKDFDSVTYGPAKGYNSNWREKEQEYIAKGRALQPLLPTVAKLLPAAEISVFKDKRPSGWYLSGWDKAKMDSSKDSGIDSSACLAIKSVNGGGASYQTKRSGAAINLQDREKADWILSFYVSTGAGNTNGMRIKIIDLSDSKVTKEIAMPEGKDTDKEGWKKIEIPFSACLANQQKKINLFSGFYVRCGESLQAPVYIDQISLEPAAN